MRITTVLLLFLMIGNNLIAQTCTDSNALNVGENAPCLYPKTKKRLKKATKLDVRTQETSGLIRWDDGLWTFNDSGGSPSLYKVNEKTGKVVQILRITNADNRDWEEIAQDEKYIYIGDVGNNKGYRKDLKIYRVDKETIRKTVIQETYTKYVTADSIMFSYPEQENFEKRVLHHFDCEGFFVHNEQLHLFTKNRDNAKTYHYTVPVSAGRHTATLQDSFDVKGQITAADRNEEGVVVLLGYTPQRLFLWIFWDYEGERFFSGNCRRIELGRFFWRGQMEGICFTDGLKGFISAENIKIKKQHLRKFDLSPFVNF